MKQAKRKEQIRIFKNRILEAFTKSSLLIGFVTYFPFVIVFLVINYLQNKLSFPVSLLVFFAGLLSWTLIEYILHRFVFHFISDSKFVHKALFFIHGIHHRTPQDEERLIMPPLPGLIILFGFFFIFKAVLGHFVFAFLAGLVLGYIIYAFVHYYIHAYQPPTVFLKKLWSHHSYHHYIDSKKCFGVSSPFWDIIFRTMPLRKK